MAIVQSFIGTVVLLSPTMSTTTLDSLGMHRMDDSEIAGFLASQGVGILGLPTDGAPYLLPMSFGFDGEDALYFTYVLGEQSTKRQLTHAAESARFLVYSAPSKFTWESVQLTGTIEQVPADEWGDLADVLARAWRPATFEEAAMTGEIEVYRFEIEQRVGFKQTGLPPGFSEQ